MITKKDIIAFGNKIARHAEGSTGSRSMYPLREWILGLGVSAVLFVGGVVYAGFLFTSQIVMVEREVDVETNVAIYESGLMEEVLSVYRERRSTFMVASERERGVVGTSTLATTTVQIAE